MSFEVSAVVVTYNSSAVVGECLRSLLSSRGIEDIDIVVVDNASKDRTLEEVRFAAPSARVIRNPSNRGLAAANNQGLRAAQHEAVLICNPDTVFEPEALRAMVEVLRRHDRAGWVVPRLVYEDGSTQTSAGDLPTLAQALFGRQLARRRSSADPHGFWWDAWGHDQERPIGRGHEAAYIVSRSAVTDVGLQDERYVLDWEGFDWTDRFRRKGWEIWFTPEARVLHRGGDSIRAVALRWVISQHRGMYLYFADRRPVVWKPVLLGLFGCRAVIKLLSMRLGMPLYSWAHRDRRS